MRAHPVLHDVFYAVITRSGTARRLLGRVKSQVRTTTSAAGASVPDAEDPAVRARREAAVTARLGLQLPEARR